MTQEDKKLLLKDLSARLPYGVKAHYIVHHVIENEYDEWDAVVDDLSDFIPGCKLYLRPMSSMADKEKKELQGLVGPVIYDEENNTIVGLECNTFEQFTLLENWLNKKMFDYRGLIEKGLALEAPEGMY